MKTPAEIILAKTPMPTHLSSEEEVRGQWSADIRRRALFSARTTQVRYLQKMQEVLSAVAEGKINQADARLALIDQLEALGYTAEEGFPGDAARGVPPAEGLADLSSRRRLDLILDTQRQMAHSAARIAAQTPETVAQFPAWRLAQTSRRHAPRPDWRARWSLAGEACGWQDAHTAEYVALKNSPIWAELGNGAGGFQDTLGNPYPPFAYSSGMSWTAVPAEECRRLGLHPATAELPEATLSPSQLEARRALAQMGPDFADILRKELGA